MPEPSPGHVRLGGGYQSSRGLRTEILKQVVRRRLEVCSFLLRITFYEIGDLDSENLRQRCNGQQTYVHFSALQRPDGVPMQIGKLRQAFLRQSTFFSDLAQSLAERNQHWIFRIWHGGYCTDCASGGLHG